jgi:HK97 family phage portal protein
VEVELQGQRVLYTLSTLSGQVEVGPSDVLHIKGLSLDGLRGLSPVKQAATALGLASSLQQSAKPFTEQASRPSGVLTVPNGSNDQLKHIQSAWSIRHAGVANQHRVAVVSGDVKFEPIAFSQSDQEFLGQRELATREVARVFGIPSWAIGGSSGDSLTYSNTTEQNRALVTHALRPWATRVERALSSDADLFPGGLYCQFDFDGLLRASPEARAQQYTAALDPKTGWMQRSEIRALEDLAPENEEMP